MSKLIIRGGLPGMIRVELEGHETAGIEVDSGLSLYSGLHALQPWLQALADEMPAPMTVDLSDCPVQDPARAGVITGDVDPKKPETCPPDIEVALRLGTPDGIGLSPVAEEPKKPSLRPSKAPK